jgi:hypothetical protein
MTQPTKKQIDEMPAAPLIQGLLKTLGYPALGFALLIPVYQDYKATNAVLLEQVKASTVAATATASAINKIADSMNQAHSRVDEMRTTVSSMAESVRVLAAKRGVE